MYKIEKSTLFTELTVKQSASVSGGNTTDPVIELAQKLAEYGNKLNATVNVVTNSNPTSNGSGNTSNASPAASEILPGLELVSGGAIKVKKL